MLQKKNDNILLNKTLHNKNIKIDQKTRDNSTIYKNSKISSTLVDFKYSDI